jgi:hypothetical protein
VEQTLRDALPEEKVVRFDHSFEPNDFSALEFFKRAKMIVVKCSHLPPLMHVVLITVKTQSFKKKKKIQIQTQTQIQINNKKR